MEKFREIMNQIYKIVVCFVILLISIVISYKILKGDIAFDMSKFSFSDLLSLILALFSIALSLIFYHKATETSNTFYNNTYNFTNHVSEVLGRIESGFTERLRHIDEGYSKLEGKFDRIPQAQKKEAEKEIEEEQKEIKKKEDARNKILQDLADRANLQDAEKDEIIDRLRKQEDELSNAKSELELLQRKLHRAELAERRGTPLRHMVHYAKNEIVSKLGPDEILKSSRSSISQKFNELKNDLAKGFIHDMSERGFLDTDEELTATGLNFLRSAARD